MNKMVSDRTVNTLIIFSPFTTIGKNYICDYKHVFIVAEWLRVRLRVRMVRGSTLTVGNFLSLENLNVIIRAIN